MLLIPLRAVPNQSTLVTLGNQAVQLNVRQRRTGLFIDVLVANQPIILGVIGRDRNLIVRSVYLGFVGDLSFLDSQGTTDPVYSGLGPGGRYALAYLETSDLLAGVG